MVDHTLFAQKAPAIIEQLMADFQLSDIQAAAILGNIGHECAGFHALHELGQPEGRGGYGWAQWTGPRREKFLAWCKQYRLDWQSEAANYGFLKHELETTEGAAIAALLRGCLRTTSE
jgi:Phage tail lysozyme